MISAESFSAVATSLAADSQESRLFVGSRAFSSGANISNAFSSISVEAFRKSSERARRKFKRNAMRAVSTPAATSKGPISGIDEIADGTQRRHTNSAATNGVKCQDSNGDPQCRSHVSKCSPERMKCIPGKLIPECAALLPGYVLRVFRDPANGLCRNLLIGKLWCVRAC